MCMKGFSRPKDPSVHKNSTAPGVAVFCYRRSFWLYLWAPWPSNPFFFWFSLVFFSQIFLVLFFFSDFPCFFAQFSFSFLFPRISGVPRRVRPRQGTFTRGVFAQAPSGHIYKGCIRICLPVHCPSAPSHRQPYCHTNVTSPPCWRTTELRATNVVTPCLLTPCLNVPNICTVSPPLVLRKTNISEQTP